MKITFLGTSDGIPRKNRACASTLIETGDKLYLIDAGAPVINKIIDMGKKIEEIEAIFITHSHADHIYGLIDIVRCVNNKNISNSNGIDIFMPEPHIEHAIKEYFLEIIKPVSDDCVRFKEYSSGVIYEDENIRVAAIPTAHMKDLGRPSYSFCVECEGKRLLFSGDLSQRLKYKDFPEIAYTDVDLFVCEMAHFNLDDARGYLEKCKAKRVFFNHIKEIYENDVKSENASGKFSFPMNVPSDGEEIEL